MTRRKKKKTSGTTGGTKTRPQTLQKEKSMDSAVFLDPIIVGGALFLLGAGYFFWSMVLRGLIMLAVAGVCVFTAFRSRT